MYVKEKYTDGDYELNYAIDYPPDFDEKKEYPVLFYFHGMGSVQKGIDFVISECPVRRENMPQDIDFIIVSPSCDDYMWFEHFNNIIHFIQFMEEKSYVNKNKCCLAGTSMGGYTCWLLLVLHSELFSASVICCGGGLYWSGKNVKVPVIAVHGDKDETVLPRESEIMVKKINESGGNAKLIIKKGFGHNVWTDTYSDHHIYRWLYDQNKNSEK